MDYLINNLINILSYVKILNQLRNWGINVKKIYVQKENVLNYILELLNIYKGETIKLENARYHHNTDYKDGKNVVENGILTLQSLSDKGLMELSKEQLKIMDDTSSHINGINGVSLAVVGLKDLYRDEFEYDPFDDSKLDIIVDTSLHARRTSTNYGNEYIADGNIDVSYIRAIDIRLEECINKVLNTEDEKIIIEMVERFNYLIEIASSLINSNILLREASFEQYKVLDKENIAKLNKITI
jgi:hypothetical protein